MPRFNGKHNEGKIMASKKRRRVKRMRAEYPIAVADVDLIRLDIGGRATHWTLKYPKAKMCVRDIVSAMDEYARRIAELNEPTQLREPRRGKKAK